MIRVKWELDEAIVLYDLYFKEGQTLSIAKDKLNELSQIMKNRAVIKGLIIDDKFRNVTGLSMQIGCIHYVVTNGKEGLSNVSRVFYEAFDVYRNDPTRFNRIVTEFYCKYQYK